MTAWLVPPQRVASVVRERDRYRCRWCGLSTDGGRVYVFSAAVYDDARGQLLLCHRCAGLLKGPYWRMGGLAHFTGADGRTYIDATGVVYFEAVG